MSKHTPGPWKWIGPNKLCGDERGNEEVLKAGDDGEPLGLDEPTIEHHWDADQAKANAALIAAAPDLLEVVQKFIAWSDAENDYKGTTSHERIEMCREAEELARAVIAKAEGKS